ncbi:MAG: hypothetical protein WCD79_21320 [Chthoniobacteraceae bacterium]
MANCKAGHFVLCSLRVLFRHLKTWFYAFVKTTLYISDTFFRKTKATAALDGQSFGDFVIEAVKEKLARPARGRKGWQAVFGKLPAKAAREMRAIVADPEFRKIDWK